MPTRDMVESALRTYKMSYGAIEEMALDLIDIGETTDNPCVGMYTAFKNGYEWLQIEYQSFMATSAMN
jgi:hypothetical protein